MHLSTQIFYKIINYKNKNFKIKEPFDGLFTQEMVCHETYKDENNNWLSQEEIELKDKKYHKINDPKSMVYGPIWI